MKKNASFVRFLLASMLFASLLPVALAQWSWKDKDGRRVFSDQPPPPSIADKDILKRPAGAKAPAPDINTTETAAPSATGATASPTLKISSKDAELEKRKKDAELQEAAKKKAEAEKTAAARKDNCERAKRAKTSFDSGVRIASTNAKGEREFISDSARTAESKRLQEIISSDCS